MRNRGFTLIELIVVMAMLTVIMAITVPRFANFFRGQSVNEEIRRFAALLEYARNEAISTATQIDFYINTQTGQYGMRAAAGYSLEEKKKFEFQLDETLSFELFRQEQVKFRDDTAHILFLPDGYLDDISVKALKIVDETDPEQSRILAQTNIGMGYEWLQDGEQVVKDLYDTLNAQGLNTRGTNPQGSYR